MHVVIILIHHGQEAVERVSELASVEEWAAETGVSRRVMERRFQAVLGRSPHAMIRHERVERAKLLLSTTDLPVSIIATFILIRAFDFTFNNNPEWQQSGTNNFAVELILGKFYDLDPGSAVQACNIASGLGRFSELEYHAPAIGGDTGRDRCEDVSSVWAFRGGEEAIREIARRLIGAAR